MHLCSRGLLTGSVFAIRDDPGYGPLWLPKYWVKAQWVGNDLEGYPYTRPQLFQNRYPSEYDYLHGLFTQRLQEVQLWSFRLFRLFPFINSRNMNYRLLFFPAAGNNFLMPKMMSYAHEYRKACHHGKNNYINNNPTCQSYNNLN